jgi:uncharacterized membrane protein
MMADWLTLYGLDLFAAFWLLGCWAGYAAFAKRQARTSFCISSVLHFYRKQWMFSVLRRENRITDASLLSSLERNASFLASTAMLIIAGLVTTLASVDTVHATLMTVPFSRLGQTPLQLQFKVMLLLLIYIYAFFTFTWSMRQYGFCAIMLGAAPLYPQPTPEAEQFARHASKVIDEAGLSYNYGLRAFYFSLSVLAWVFSLWLFVLAVAVVVAVLYEREFKSKTLRAMIQASALRETSLD